MRINISDANLRRVFGVLLRFILSAGWDAYTPVCQKIKRSYIHLSKKDISRWQTI